jgi:hypothetical protein
LRALSLCTCCRHYPGAAAGRRRRSSHPAVSTFPDNVVGSACTPSFSRPAQRSLALRPAHSRRHLYVTCYTEGFSHFVTSMTAPVASGWSDLAGWGLHPLESAALSRRTRLADTADRGCGSLNWGESAPTDSLGKDRSPPKAACLRPNPTAHSSGIPALRRPSDDRSIISTKRGSPPSDIWDVFHAAMVLNGAVEGGAR